MSLYHEINEKAYKHNFEGIFYAFSDKQFEEGMKKCGYDENTKLVKDGMGGFGTKEAFDERRKFYKKINDEIREKCTPEEIFEYEWWNHECGLTYDYSEALEITQEYFPDWEPEDRIVNKLQDKFNENY